MINMVRKFIFQEAFKRRRAPLLFSEPVKFSAWFGVGSYLHLIVSLEGAIVIRCTQLVRMIYTVFEAKALVWKSNDKNRVPIFFVQSLVGPYHVFGPYLKIFKIKR